jgi:hypothetical protein
MALGGWIRADLMPRARRAEAEGSAGAVPSGRHELKQLTSPEDNAASAFRRSFRIFSIVCRSRPASFDVLMGARRARHRYEPDSGGTMRFMILGKATKESEAGILPKPEAFAAMQEYNAELVKAGILLAAEGLSPSSKGARVKISGDERTVIDGPFTEAKELVAGFSIIQAKSLDEAIEWVKRVPNVFPDGEAEIEIRKVMDLEDFGEDFTPNAEIAKVKIT